MLRHVSGKIRSLAYGNKFLSDEQSKKLIRENFAVEKIMELQMSNMNL